MKVNDPNLQGPSGISSTGVSRPGSAGRGGTRSGGASAGQGDGVELSALAQTVRSLETESPERQAHVESLARAYAEGRYPVDPDATAGGVIDDSLKHR